MASPSIVSSKSILYPDCPGEPYYTLTSPTFDRAEIDTERGTLVIEKHGEGYIDGLRLF